MEKSEIPEISKTDNSYIISKEEGNPNILTGNPLNQKKYNSHPNTISIVNNNQYYPAMPIVFPYPHINIPYYNFGRNPDFKAQELLIKPNPTININKNINPYNETDDNNWKFIKKNSDIIIKGTELFVGNLAIETNEIDLYNFFKSSGEIVDVS